jgi:hypothetical protein
MSAINTLIKRDSVSLICDAASYSAEGRFIAAVPKVALLPQFSAAVACRGPRVSVPLFADLLSAAAASYDELKAKAPAFVRELQPMLNASFAWCELGAEFDIVVAASHLMSPSVIPHRATAIAACSISQEGAVCWFPDAQLCWISAAAPVLREGRESTLRRDSSGQIPATNVIRSELFDHLGVFQNALDHRVSLAFCFGFYHRNGRPNHGRS